MLGLTPGSLCSSTEDGHCRCGHTPSTISENPSPLISESSSGNSSPSTIGEFTWSTAPSSSSGSLPEDVPYSFAREPAPPTVVDIRPARGFYESHVRLSHNCPLPEAPTDLFGDAHAVEKRWRELQGAVEGDAWPHIPHGRGSATKLAHADPTLTGSPPGWGSGQVIVLCSDGESGKMAASILRSRGQEAYCVEGGYNELRLYLTNSARVI